MRSWQACTWLPWTGVIIGWTPGVTVEAERAKIARALYDAGFAAAIAELKRWQRSTWPERVPETPPVEPHQGDGLNAAIAILERLAKESE